MTIDEVVEQMNKSRKNKVEAVTISIPIVGILNKMLRSSFVWSGKNVLLQLKKAQYLHDEFEWDDNKAAELWRSMHDSGES